MLVWLGALGLVLCMPLGVFCSLVVGIGLGLVTLWFVGMLQAFSVSFALLYGGFCLVVVLGVLLVVVVVDVCSWVGEGLLLVTGRCKQVCRGWCRGCSRYWVRV